MMQPWFEEAKLGIFIHWGIYAVKGIAESWSFFNKEVTYDDYMGQLNGFTAEGYDPRQWAALFKRAGAKYAVLTTKHHDGVALWDTKQNDLNVVKATPAGRDLVGPFVEAVREAGLHAGPLLLAPRLVAPGLRVGPQRRPPPRREGRARAAQPILVPAGRHPRAARTVAAVHRVPPRAVEGDLHAVPPRPAVVRRRLGARRRSVEHGPIAPATARVGRAKGDPQQPHARPRRLRHPRAGRAGRGPEGPWEFCVTMGDSWAYKYQETFKPAWMLVRLFAECIGMGGNMLLNCAPNKEGIIVPEQAERLEALGAWIAKHAEAVYGTTAGLPHGHAYGPSTMNKARDVLYVMTFDRPVHGLAVKGIRNKIKRASVLGGGSDVGHKFVGGASWANIPGVLYLDVPAEALDPHATVIKLELDGPLDLFHGEGHAIEAN
jgi:alpha-L-fucosidase